jgi:histidinol dehydrogenase
MKIIKYSDDAYSQEIEALVERCDVDFQSQDETVRSILAAVKKDRDEALLKFTNQFDHTDYQLSDIEVQPEEIQEAYNQIELDELEAMKLAADNINRFHARQVQESWEYKEDGVTLGQAIRPLSIVGIYVPGGKASYPSSVLMNAIPARVAGVDQVIMCSPTPKGVVSPHVLVAADIAGVDRIFKVGGAQAVAAMAMGTDIIPRVDKIVGPGNIYVALAKRMVFGLVDIDMIAGPSEILVIADDSAHPEYIAADLLSQAEHDEEAVPILVTPSESLAKATLVEIEKQKMQLKRTDIIEASLSNKCRLIVTASLDEALDLANRIAPEHLELAVENPEECAKRIQNAGAIFLGHYTPEAIGDYLAGPNHVLPTSGTARFSSPLGVYDFVKRTSLITYSREALAQAGKSCRILAEMEDLDAHARAVQIRIS